MNIALEFEFIGLSPLLGIAVDACLFVVYTPSGFLQHPIWEKIVISALGKKINATGTRAGQMYARPQCLFHINSVISLSDKNFKFVSEVA